MEYLGCEETICLFTVWSLEFNNAAIVLRCIHFQYAYARIYLKTMTQNRQLPKEQVTGKCINMFICVKCLIEDFVVNWLTQRFLGMFTYLMMIVSKLQATTSFHDIWFISNLKDLHSWCVWSKGRVKQICTNYQENNQNLNGNMVMSNVSLWAINYWASLAWGSLINKSKKLHTTTCPKFPEKQTLTFSPWS